MSEAECENLRLLHCTECGRHTPRLEGRIVNPSNCKWCGGKLIEHESEPADKPA